MTIVCGIDTTDASRHAVHLAAAVAKRLGIQLHLVHAVEAPDFDDSHIEPSMKPAVDALHKRLAERSSDERLKLDALALEAAAAVETKVTTEVGRAWEVLLRVAKTDNATHIVVGPHASQTVLEKIGERLLGSTARRVVRHAECKVWVACGDIDAACAALADDSFCAAVGIDFLAGGRAALAEAKTLRAQIVAVHSLRDPFTAGDSPADWSSLRKQWRERVAVDLAEAVPSARSCHVEMGDPVLALNRVTESESAHAVILGAHAGGTVTRILVGDTAERALRLSSVPVLVVPPES